MERRRLAVIVSFTLVTLGILAYLAFNFRINDDLTNMISDKLPFRHLEKEFFDEFPQLSEVIVVVVDADTVGEAMDAGQRIAERCRKEGDIFTSVSEPGGGEFFSRNGLLFLDVKELEELSDNLAMGEPLMGLLLNDYSLRGFFSMLGTVVDNYEGDESDRMDILFDRVATAFTNSARNRPARLSWEGLMYGDKDILEQRRQFVIIQPLLDKEGMLKGEPPSDAMHRIVSDLKLDSSVKVRITGDVILNYENVITVRESVGIATFASLLLVAFIIFVGLGSGRLVIASLITLLTGLIWTTGFAIFFIGSLNLISITFGVLFVGIGIDYGIQFCLRYRELREKGDDNRGALITTANGVGNGLMLSCMTTALGFFAFLPTAYSGVAQLGLISGVGMFICFFCNLTLLPALLSVIGFTRGIYPAFLSKMSVTNFPYRHYRGICVAAALLACIAAFALPRVYFDYNPLNLYNPASEAIVTMKELFLNKQAPPWSISILCDGKEEAERLCERLGRLKVVSAAISISDFVPEEQPEKLGIISNMALFMGSPGPISMKRLPLGENTAALDGLEKRLAGFISSHPDQANGHIGKLLGSLKEFKSFIRTTGNGDKGFDDLEKGLLSGLPSLLERLDTMLKPTPVTEADLPQELVREYVSPTGRYRVQVLPKENILDVGALSRFVRGVKSVAPNAVDIPVTVYETGNAVVSSFRLATILALVAVVSVLLLTLRSLFTTALVLIPLFFAIILAAAVSVIFGIHLNYANVIVLPLLLGVGVHSGIMFMLRFLTEPPPDGNMLCTSTARAVLYTNLTMIVSCVTLAFSAHRGIASMGILLTVCSTFILLSVLIVFPAMLKLFVAWRSGGPP